LGFFVGKAQEVCLGFFVKKDEKMLKKQRIVTFLDREEIDFLDKLGKDALFSCGIKISRAKILSWLVDFIQKLNLNGENIRSEIDLEKRIKELIAGQPPSHGEKQGGKI
jgi:hypothetical protein